MIRRSPAGRERINLNNYFSVQRFTLKLSYLPVLLLLMMIGGQACASKRIAKQAIKLEEEGQMPLGCQ